MRTLLLVLLLLSLSTFSVNAQLPDNKATDAWLITRMVEKFHVEPRPLDKTMSSAIYSRMLQVMDAEPYFFHPGQRRLRDFPFTGYTLDEEIQKTGGPALKQLLTTIYQQRLMQTDTLIDHDRR